MSFLYELRDCDNVLAPLNISVETELDFSKVYRFTGYKGVEEYCFQVVKSIDGPTVPVEVVGEFDSCELCQAYEPNFAEIIIEDDVNLKVSRTMTANEPLLSVKSSIIITDGVDKHTLYSYTLPFDQVYTGGYLDYNAIIPLPWNVNFPSGAINNTAEIQTAGAMLNLRLPNIINWRDFQSLPQLAVIFGTDATNNWLWYQQNGWTIKQRVETRNDVGVYVDDYELDIRDYDDNPSLIWDWKFYRLSDNALLTVPISNEKTRVVVTSVQPSTPSQTTDYSTVTVEGIEKPIRWVISSNYTHTGQSTSPLQPLATETKLKIDATSLYTELQFIFDPSKIQGQDGVKFTARNYQVDVNGLYTERNVQSFPIVKIPTPPLKDEYESDCCDCEPELKLASSTSEELIKNDITGVAHKNQTYLDTCEFKIFKGSQLLTNNGVDYPNGFPNDPNVSAFVFNWKWYLVNHGQGCYKIEKHFTVAGLPIIEEIGKYELLEYTPENAKGTARVLYQNDFQTLWDDTTINYAGSGFEDSYRFRGMFGRWQPNVMSESNFSVLNENRVASIKSKDTYLLNHFHATECHIKRLHKIVMHAAIWRMSDHNPSNTLQEKKIYECVLDTESKEDITYNAGSRVTGIEIVLSKRQQNSVSLFSGSIQVPQGATWLLPTVTGGGGGCQNGTVTITDNNGVVIGTQDVASGGVATYIVTDLPCVVSPIGGSAMPLATGQTTSYADDDDGDTQRGRPFFTLPIIGGVQQLNHFGSKWRFTGVTGSYFDMTTANYKTANGTIIGTDSTARTTAFPDYLMIDHATRDWNDNVLMYSLSSSFLGVGSMTFTTAKTYANALNVAGFTNWFVPNINELINSFLYWEVLTYPPLVISPQSLGTSAFMSCTTYTTITTDIAGVRFDTKLVGNWAKTLSAPVLTYVFVRITNISEL